MSYDYSTSGLVQFLGDLLALWIVVVAVHALWRRWKQKRSESHPSSRKET